MLLLGSFLSQFIANFTRLLSYLCYGCFSAFVIPILFLFPVGCFFFTSLVNGIKKVDCSVSQSAGVYAELCSIWTTTCSFFNESSHCKKKERKCTCPIYNFSSCRANSIVLANGLLFWCSFMICEEMQLVAKLLMMLISCMIAAIIGLLVVRGH